MSEASKMASVWGQVAHLLAANARVEGMKAENAAAEAKGEIPANGGSAFYGEANVMQEIGQNIGGIG